MPALILVGFLLPALGLLPLILREWRLLGRTPLPLFDLQRADEPAWLAAGDEVHWQAVDRATHDRLAADWARGSGSREAFLVPAEGVPCPVV